MTTQDFIKRRKQLMQMMGEDTVAILPAAPIRMRNRDVEYCYRPDSDFYYLTGGRLTITRPMTLSLLMILMTFCLVCWKTKKECFIPWALTLILISV